MFAMLNCRVQKAVGRKQKADKLSAVAGAARFHKVFFCILLSAFCLLPTGCRRDMQDQPKAIAYRESTFFKDGVASRPPVEGTVPRGFLRADREFYFGKKSGYRTGSGSDRVIDSTGQQPGANSNSTAMFPDDVESFPLPITKEVLERGQERYDIFCSSCHGMTGYGDGMVARRGFNKPAPASFHQDKLRQAPVGHFFDAITNGWGAMPSHASQIPVEDRWKIIAYVRALQLSQMPPAGSANERGTNPTVREDSAKPK